MVIAVVADLVPPARCDLGAGVGVLVDHLAGDHERRRDLVAVQQLVDAGQCGAHVIVAARHRAGRRQIERARPQRLRVEVDRQRHCAPIALPPHAHILPEGCDIIKSMEGITRLAASQLLDGYRRRTISPVEVVEALAVAIEQHNESLTALYTVCLDRAREEARAAEAAYSRGEVVGAAGGRAVRGQGPVRHRGRADDLRLADVRRPRPRPRRRSPCAASAMPGRS